ncbi:hypothetical protein G5C51_20555 [Streptomyces sp. A7024]|uniref:Uncharacterized protein n=1 Tax=Streptomyces coryli TaxID=1128680 RepID=A0A6G4U1Z0_9ACTN|nr:hypothetical protein [Streptomyces coryli]NGN66279.1 hypothetical protein [Streptomyces coryli]
MATMNTVVLDKAVFLLRDVHQSPSAAQRALKGYFPELGLIERAQHVRAAYDSLHAGRILSRPAPSELSDPSRFAAAHERHGFGD